MKRPSFQFYPADWLKDPALQSCSLAANGLWIKMLCIMHQCMPYGHLTVKGKPMTVAQLARNVGEQEKFVEELLIELDDADVFERDAQGCVFSRRMVRDENIRNKRAEGGKLGGNPLLLKQKVSDKDGRADHLTSNQRVNHSDNVTPQKKDNYKDNNKVESESNLSLTPSSSSSVSSSSSISSSSVDSSSSSKMASVEIYQDRGEMSVSHRGRDDDCPMKAEEWAEYFAQQGGIRPKVWPFFTAWCAARVTIRQVAQAIGAAREKSSEPIACLPAYVDRILASQARERRQGQKKNLEKQAALEAHNAHIASQWLSASEVQNASAG